jgi:hypothetical protein
MTWDYAELSKAAKAAGGPEELIELIKDNAKYLGRIEGRASMIPWMIVAILVTAGLTYGTVKLIEQRKAKKTALLLQTEDASSEIINILNSKGITHKDLSDTTDDGEDDHGQER